MTWTHPNAWARGLAIVALAVGVGAVAVRLAPAQPPTGSTPVPPKVGQAAEVEALKKEVEALRQRVEALGRRQKAEPRRPLVASTPLVRDVVLTQPYVAQIHSRHHIEIRSLRTGYLERITVKEGQAVKKGEVLFQLQPILYQARLEGEMADARIAEIEYANVKKLVEDNVASQTELALARAKLDKAQAKVNLAKAELAFTIVRAPFDGIVDRQMVQQGSLVKEGEILTTLSDNEIMWVYFEVPEARYFEYMAYKDRDLNSQRLELVLANGKRFPPPGTLGAIEAQFNDKSGNISFRADFPNPDKLLRHGQRGTVLMRRTVKDAVVIPRRATFEVLGKRYVYVVGQDDVVRPREVVVRHELEDLFVVAQGVGVTDRIIVEGVRQLRDGDKVDYTFRKPETVLPGPNK